MNFCLLRRHLLNIEPPLGNPIYAPPLVIVEYLNFHRQLQKIGATEWWDLMIHCDLGAHLGKAFRDCFVCRLRNENKTNQKCLLTKEDLTFSGGGIITHGMESISENVWKLQATKIPGDIHKLTLAQVRLKNVANVPVQHNQKSAYVLSLQR